MWNDVDIAWVAGLIEGEGCISLVNKGTSVRIAVKMTDYDVLATAKSIFGGTISGPEIQARKKPAWSWRVSDRKESARLLLAIAPCMHGRRKEAILQAANVLHEAFKPKPCTLCKDSYFPTRSTNIYCLNCRLKHSGSARAKKKAVRA